MSWNVVKDFYINELNVPEEIVDILSVYDICHDICSGFSNEFISDSYDIPGDYLESLAKQYLKFPGWNRDLDINPLLVYNRSKGIEELYYAYIMPVKMLTKKEVKNSYIACNIFSEMERKLNDYYG